MHAASSGWCCRHRRWKETDDAPVPIRRSRSCRCVGLARLVRERARSAATEQARVERHVRECVACSREVDELRRLQALLRTEEAEPSMAVSRQRTRALLDRQDASPRASSTTCCGSGAGCRRGRARRSSCRPCCSCCPPSLLLAGRPAERLYHALSERSDIATNGDVVVVVFDADQPQREMRALLQGLAGHIIDGPNAVGAYTLQLPRRPAGQACPSCALIRRAARGARTAWIGQEAVTVRGLLAAILGRAAGAGRLRAADPPVPIPAHIPGPIASF